MKTPPTPRLDYTDLLLDAICVVDRHGRFLSISPAGETIFGYTPAEMLGCRMIDFVVAEDRERTLATVDRIMAGQSETHFENRYRRKDGRIAHIMWSARWSEADQVRVAVARDVSRLKEAKFVQRAIYDISEAAHTAQDLADLCARIHRIVGALLPAANFDVALYDERRETIEHPYHVDERDTRPAPTALDSDTLSARVIRTGRYLLLNPQQLADWPGALRNAEDSATRYWLGVPLPSSQQGTIGAVVVKSYRDSDAYTDDDRQLLQFVSTQIAQAIERKRMVLRLEHMALHDDLTGLANRRLFDETLQAVLDAPAGSGLALLFVDLDDFKDVNDRHGHATGDALLRAVAERLRGVLGETALLARLGGDEFVALLHPCAGRAEAQIAAERVREAFESAFESAFAFGECTLHITPSLGLALYPEDGRTATALLRIADEAMYWEKTQRGPDRIPVRARY